MIELPDEIWGYIKEFTFDWKRSHKLKMAFAYEFLINSMYGEIYGRWTCFPPPSNTNDIIRNINSPEYPRSIQPYPPPDLPLTSICNVVESNGVNLGYYCGYGWGIKHAESKLVL